MFNIALSVKDNHGNTKLKVHVVLSSWTQGVSWTFIRQIRSIYVLYPGSCVLYINCTQNCVPHAYAPYPSLMRALTLINRRLMCFFRSCFVLLQFKSKVCFCVHSNELFTSCLNLYFLLFYKAACMHFFFLLF